MLNIKDQIEEISDKIEMKFDLEKFYPFQDKIYKLFNELKNNVKIAQKRKDNKSI